MENSSIFGNKSNSITGVLLIYHSFLSFISPTAQLLVWLVCRCSAMWWFFFYTPHPWPFIFIHPFYILLVCQTFSLFELCLKQFFFLWSSDQVNDSFVEFLIDAIETSEHEEEFMEAFTPLILAFNHHFVGKERRTNVSVYATAHLLLPLPNINSNLSSVACCWVRGGIGVLLLRYWHWSGKSILQQALVSVQRTCGCSVEPENLK